MRKSWTVASLIENSWPVMGMDADSSKARRRRNSVKIWEWMDIVVLT